MFKLLNSRLHDSRFEALTLPNSRIKDFGQPENSQLDPRSPDSSQQDSNQSEALLSVLRFSNLWLQDPSDGL